MSGSSGKLCFAGEPPASEATPEENSFRFFWLTISLCMLTWFWKRVQLRPPGDDVADDSPLFRL